MKLQLKLFALFFVSIYGMLLPAKAQTETHELPPFDEVVVTGDIEAVLQAGRKPTARVEVEGIELDKVVTEVEGMKLHIKLKPGIYPDAEVKVYIVFDELREVRANAGARAVVEDVIKGDKLEVYAGSGGRVELAVEVNVLEQRVMEGSKITVEGYARNQASRVYSGGILDAEQLRSEYAFVRVNTGGMATVHVREELEASVGTGGKLTYYGAPPKESVKTLLGAKIQRIE